MPSALVTGEALFPYRLRLKRPGPSEVSHRFPEVRAWIADLRTGEATGYRIEWRAVNFRDVGGNPVPVGACRVDSPDDALRLIDRRAAADRLLALVDTTRRRQPALLDVAGAAAAPGA